MKKLIILSWLFLACNGIAQDTDYRIIWFPNAVEDSVTHYELYIVENPDSMILHNLGWENTFSGATQQPYYSQNYPHSFTADTLQGIFTVPADGEYLQCYLVAVNVYGKSMMAGTNIVLKPRERVPVKADIIMLRIE